MRRSKGLLVAGLLVAVGMIIAVAAFVASGENLFDISTKETVQLDIDIEEEFTAVSVKSTDCDIVFEYDKDGKEYISFDGDKNKTVDREIKDGELVIEVKNGEGIWNFLHIGFTNDKLTVHLNKDHYEIITASTTSGNVSLDIPVNLQKAVFSSTSGDIECDGINVKDIITASVTSGNINMTDVVSDNIQVSATSGDFKFSGVKAGRIKAEATSGNIDLIDSVAATVNVKASSGEIKTEKLEATESIKMDATSGEVTLKDTNAKDNFNITTSSGDIVIQNCDSKRFDITTTTGDVKCKFAVKKYVVPKTSSGRIITPFDMTGAVGEAYIVTSSGNIIVEE